MSSSGTSIDALVGRVAWQGNDAMRFRARWRSQMRPELGAVTTTLEGLATALTRQAAEQRHPAAPALTAPGCPACRACSSGLWLVGHPQP